MNPLPESLTLEAFDEDERPAGIGAAWLMIHREAEITFQVYLGGNGSAEHMNLVLFETCHYCRPHTWDKSNIRYWGEMARCSECEAEWATSDIERFRVYGDLVFDQLWLQVEGGLEARGFNGLETEIMLQDIRAGLAHLFSNTSSPALP